MMETIEGEEKKEECCCCSFRVILILPIVGPRASSFPPFNNLSYYCMISIILLYHHEFIRSSPFSPPSPPLPLSFPNEVALVRYRNRGKKSTALQTQTKGREKLKKRKEKTYYTVAYPISVGTILSCNCIIILNTPAQFQALIPPTR